jgi:hypothetical protein
MSSSIDYLEYVLDLLSDIENITYKKMMGEYILYCDGIIFGGIYDNRFLIKKTKTLENMGFKEEIPYPSAKPMYLVDIENREEINELIYKLINDLK